MAQMGNIHSAGKWIGRSAETVAIVKEMRAASEPEALADALCGVGLPLERVGLEACSLTARLHDGLRAAGWAALCIETRQAKRP